MTREEAIRLIGWQKCTTNREDDLEAIDMAIEALQILGDDGIVNCCGCIHWKTDGGAMMMCELWDTPMGDFDYCSYGKREKPTIPTFAESAEAYKAWTGEEMGRPHGEWIEYEPSHVYMNGEEVYAYMNNYTCSVCGGEAHLKYDYCPNCGALMGGDTK